MVKNECLSQLVSVFEQHSLEGNTDTKLGSISLNLKETNRKIYLKLVFFFIIIMALGVKEFKYNVLS